MYVIYCMYNMTYVSHVIIYQLTRAHLQITYANLLLNLCSVMFSYVSFVVDLKQIALGQHNCTIRPD